MSWNKMDRMRLESDVLETEIRERAPQNRAQEHTRRIWLHLVVLAGLAAVVLLSLWGVI